MVTRATCIVLLGMSLAACEKEVKQSTSTPSSADQTQSSGNGLSRSSAIPKHTSNLGYDCSTQSDIPEKECRGLVAIYNVMGGDNWTDKKGWGGTTPEFWSGVHTTAGYVSMIDLDNRNLTGPLPPQLANFTKLSIIDLSGNKLVGPISKELLSIETLTMIDLMDNQLEGKIPTSIAGLSLLEVLDLSQNQLTGPIPAGIGSLPELTVLDLSKNHLEGEVPHDFKGLKIDDVIMLSSDKCLTATDQALKGHLDDLDPSWNAGC